jgi:HK97 family phage major capsid protein
MTDLATTSFDGFTCRDELSSFVANAARTGAPFARALTPMQTNRRGITFPVASPEGFGWTAEGSPINDVDLQDDSYSVGVAKLAGIVTMSSEFVDDNELPIGDLLSRAVQDSMGPTLDHGLLYGTGAPEPTGIVAAATLGPEGDDLRSALIAAWGEMIDSGSDGEGLVAFAAGSVVAAELGRVDSENRPIYPTGSVLTIAGVRVVPVPSLVPADALLVDVRSTWLVVRDDFEARMSDQAKFERDQIVMRVRGRFTAACPTPTKSIRRLDFPAPVVPS